MINFTSLGVHSNSSELSAPFLLQFIDPSYAAVESIGLMPSSIFFREMIVFKLVYLAASTDSAS